MEKGKIEKVKGIREERENLGKYELVVRGIVTLSKNMLNLNIIEDDVRNQGISLCTSYICINVCYNKHSGRTPLFEVEGRTKVNPEKIFVRYCQMKGLQLNFKLKLEPLLK